ncbi:MAG: recombinase zinc beta ribbon domain-containing protein [Geminicoccales bacterium]
MQSRLSTGAKAPARKDINADVPLRGFVLCEDCSKPLTACWFKSKTGKKHPYYLCPTKTCASYRKSIRRDALEGEFSTCFTLSSRHRSSMTLPARCSRMPGRNVRHRPTP